MNNLASVLASQLFSSPDFYSISATDMSGIVDRFYGKAKGMGCICLHIEAYVHMRHLLKSFNSCTMQHALHVLPVMYFLDALFF
jgi:hypothetical protein